MYFIEVHSPDHAQTKVISEPRDALQSTVDYEPETIYNHVGVDPDKCRWCKEEKINLKLSKLRR